MPKSGPGKHSAYLVIASDVSEMPIGSLLLEKSDRLIYEWTVMNFETGKESGAVGRRLIRICPECRLDHRSAGVLGHDGECGSTEVKDEALAELKQVRKRLEAE